MAILSLQEVQSKVQTLPLMLALLQNMSTSTSTANSKLPAWVKKVVERAHNPPQLDFENTYQNEEFMQIPKGQELDKTGLVSQKLAKIELTRLRAKVEAAETLDDDQLAKLVERLTHNDILQQAASSIPHNDFGYRHVQNEEAE